MTRTPPDIDTLRKQGMRQLEEAKAGLEKDGNFMPTLVLGDAAVTHASLDHDLADEHYEAVNMQERQDMTGFVFEPPAFREKTGYAVVEWLEANPAFWPSGGVRVHSMNTVGKLRMEVVIKRYYGRLFP
jgi:hypothetical protein